MITKDCYSIYGNFVSELYLVNNFGITALYEINIKSDWRVDLPKLIKDLKEKFDFKPLSTNRNIESEQHYLNEEGCIIKISRFTIGSDNPSIDLICTDNFYEHGLFSQELIDYLLEYTLKDKEKNNCVNFVIKTSEGIQLLEKEIKTAQVDLDNYELSVSYDKIIESLDSPKSGLIIFNGIPGSGKSYLIKHLINTQNKHFVYIPVNVAEILSDPSFLNFAMEKLNGSVLIIEDAETVLVDRQKQMNSAASTILNITDGILGELLNIKIIATVNVEEHIDHALLRKGRLLNKVDFAKLGPEKANHLLKKLGSDVKVLGEHSLAELYNMDKSNGHEVKEKRKIGF